MSLDPGTRALLERLAAAGQQPIDAVPIAESRAALRALMLELDRPATHIASERRLKIPGPEGPVECAVYNPARDDHLRPIVVYLHGGGWARGDTDMYAGLCRYLAAAADCVVLSVEYRLAPEHPFPAGLNDSYAAVRWAVSEGHSIGGNRDRVAVVGDSAGANFCAAIALLARDAGIQLTFQGLIYPGVDLRRSKDYWSREAYGGGGYFLDLERLHWYIDHYLPTPDHAQDFRASPLLAAGHCGLAPAFVLTAECDPLRDEGAAYAETLRAAGTPVDYRCWPGTIHGFLSFSKAIPAGLDAQAWVAERLRKALHGPAVAAAAAHGDPATVRAGLMQRHPLLISSLLDYAARYHGGREIVTLQAGGTTRRYGYAQAASRAKRLANALNDLGVQPADRIATLAWNSDRHFELFYAVSGIGAVLHTVNPRLFAEQIAFILRDAADRVVFVEPEFVPLLEKLAPSLPSVEAWFVLCDDAEMPKTSLPGARSYENLLRGYSDEYSWPVFDENAAASMCYTSGTTGDPKGVVYTHRSTVLHALCAAQNSAFGVSACDVILPVANMYHAAAWGLPYVAALSGAKLVLPHRHADGASLQRLIEQERVTLACGVPTVWTMLLQYLEDSGTSIPSLGKVLIGGSAVPQTMIDTFRDRYGVQVLHLWGMTETSPLGVVATPSAEVDAMPAAERRQQLTKQGRIQYGIDLKLTGADGRRLPHDGTSSGTLWARGHWVASAYYGREAHPPLDEDGWFPTGDVATIDPLGYLQITDRTKDLIKSGGEWISSAAIEGIACGHPDVSVAAVVGVRHPKWEERPLLLVVPKPGRTPTKESVMEFVGARVARWQVPDDLVFLSELPMTATGKISKKDLRVRFQDYLIGAVDGTDASRQ